MEPSLSIDELPWMPKQRYSIMKKYMPKVGTLGHHMMKRTCTNQVNLDYHSEEDMIIKYRLMLNLEGIARPYLLTHLLIKKKFLNIKV